MSKKTNAAKQKPTKKPSSRVHPRKKGRKNPQPGPIGREAKPALFLDPIFMHHVASAILRYIELFHPVEFGISNMLNSRTPQMVDAEFPPDGAQGPGAGTEDGSTEKHPYLQQLSGTDSRNTPEAKMEEKDGE